MTVVPASKTVVESNREFIEKFDVSRDEVAALLSPDQTATAVEAHNRLADSEADIEPVSEFTNVCDDIFVEAVYEMQSPQVTILEHRDKRYIHHREFDWSVIHHLDA
jgi:hypothetical protein